MTERWLPAWGLSSVALGVYGALVAVGGGVVALLSRQQAAARAHDVDTTA